MLKHKQVHESNDLFFNQYSLNAYEIRHCSQGACDLAEEILTWILILIWILMSVDKKDEGMWDVRENTETQGPPEGKELDEFSQPAGSGVQVVDEW